MFFCFWQECFKFQRIVGGLTRSGHYQLWYILQPALPGAGAPLSLCTDLAVKPGQATRVEVQVRLYLCVYYI